ncbi:hypothetical protein [Pseudomonas sp. 6D_7.1_Bac1]|uniref:hypothetical protein n=1 Tax=Pseudomonas sp. 6D_7.1_Bac1 TaxID=2971615 RepID=UPI0021C8CBDA|nr:hypothetical protein [Pseudomonas sp. 6D_7.1_Bac1]MCU1750087.1 hypothetical protein [Pseudomonas sp. 6D_7.1_Bac1]
MPETFSILATLKLLVKPFADFFWGRWKESKGKQVGLNRFYVELSDVRDRAVEAIRLLAKEHNRRNDPKERRGRSLDSYGPVSAPYRIDFFTIRGILEKQYEDFTPDQRRRIGEVFEFVREYNECVDTLRLLNGKTFSEFEWGFALKPITALATIVFLTVKLIEQKERLNISDSETGRTAIQKVLDGYGIKLHDAILSEPEK